MVNSDGFIRKLHKHPLCVKSIVTNLFMTDYRRCEYFNLKLINMNFGEVIPAEQKSFQTWLYH